jgi:hypothetical protein
MFCSLEGTGGVSHTLPCSSSCLIELDFLLIFSFTWLFTVISLCFDFLLFIHGNLWYLMLEKLFDFIFAHPWFNVATYFSLKNIFCGKNFLSFTWLRFHLFACESKQIQSRISFIP